MPNSKLVYTTSGGNLCSICGKLLHKCKCQDETHQTATNTPHNPQIQLQKKGRAGKEVTVISHGGLGGTELHGLLQLLKKRLGTGGTLKNHSIELQGNRVSEVREILASHGPLNSQSWVPFSFRFWRHRKRYFISYNSWRIWLRRLFSSVSNRR